MQVRSPTKRYRDVLIEVYLESHLDTVQLLQAWGSWSRTYINLDIPTFAKLMRIDRKKRDSLTLSEDELMYLTDILSEVKSTNRRAFDLLVMKHIQRIPVIKMAKKLRMRVKVLTDDLKNAQHLFHNLLVERWARDHDLPQDWIDERVITVTNFK